MTETDDRRAEADRLVLAVLALFPEGASARILSDILVEKGYHANEVSNILLTGFDEGRLHLGDHLKIFSGRNPRLCG